MIRYTPANSILDGPITDLLSISCILIELFSRAHAKGTRDLINFKFGTSIDRFPSDGAASMAVKGLTETERRGGGRKDIENLGTLLNR